MTSWKLRNKLVLALILALAGVLFTPLRGYLSFEALKENAEALRELVHANYGRSVPVYILAYVVITALSVPGATVMTIAGGFLFGVFQGAIYTDAAATAGATLAFLVSRYLAGGWVQARYAARLQKFNREVEENGYRYLLTLRLIPLVPFFLINLLAGLTRIRVWTFAWTTALGILPGTLVYTFAGSRLQMIEAPGDILSPRVLAAFVLIALLPVSSVIYRRLHPRVK